MGEHPEVHRKDLEAQPHWFEVHMCIRVKSHPFPDLKRLVKNVLEWFGYNGDEVHRLKDWATTKESVTVLNIIYHHDQHLRTHPTTKTIMG